MFAGTGRTVYRTKTAGLGTRTFAEAQARLQRVDRHFTGVCGDWAEPGPARLTAPPGVTGPAVPWPRSSGRRPTRRRRGQRPRPAACSCRRTSTPTRRARSRGRGSTTTPRSTRTGSCQHLRRPGEREPRLDLVQRLRLQHAGDAGSRVRGDVQPGHRDVDVGRPLARLRRPAGHRPRPRRRDRRPLRRDRLRRLCAWLRERRRGSKPAPGMPNVEVAGLTIVPSESSTPRRTGSAPGGSISADDDRAWVGRRSAAHPRARRWAGVTRRQGPRSAAVPSRS